MLDAADAFLGEDYERMVILEGPFASTPLLEWLSASGHPVLGNQFSRHLQAPDEAGDAVSLNLVETRGLPGASMAEDASTR